MSLFDDMKSGLEDALDHEAKLAKMDALLREPTRTEEHEYDAYITFTKIIGWPTVMTFDEWLNANTKDEE